MSDVTRSYQFNPNGDTWRFISRHIDERIALRRNNLEQTGLPLDETESQRGAIEELKLLQSLAKSNNLTAVDSDELSEALGNNY